MEEAEDLDQEAAKDAKRAAERTQILAKLIRRCHYQLNRDKEAREYLTDERKLTNETIVKFRLGAFPSLDELKQHFTDYELRTAGVARLDEAGQMTSKFTLNRLIIPIFDLHGKPVALIGRVLCDEKERVRLGANKYDNTVFSKTSCLYGLNHAKSAIRAKGAVLVVEGNFDVISAVQAGVENVVGSSGAFFSPTQVALLARYADRIWLGLDADEAGQKAMEKVFARPPPEGVLIKQKNVPAGFKDWDLFFRGKMPG